MPTEITTTHATRNVDVSTLTAGAGEILHRHGADVALYAMIVGVAALAFAAILHAPTAASAIDALATITGL